jgi:glucan phosphoethanolaminetransferase (alkaline phosphatase superfamily)
MLETKKINNFQFKKTIGKIITDPKAILLIITGVVFIYTITYAYTSVGTGNSVHSGVANNVSAIKISFFEKSLIVGVVFLMILISIKVRKSINQI